MLSCSDCNGFGRVRRRREWRRWLRGLRGDRWNRGSAWDQWKPASLRHTFKAATCVRDITPVSPGLAAAYQEAFG
jgi:hypothetical protein